MTPETLSLSPHHPAPTEDALTRKILQLYTDHNEHRGHTKISREACSRLRLELGANLSSFKQLYVKPGRHGGWKRWLEEHNIARATAEACVRDYRATLKPTNCLDETISEKPVDMAKLVRKYAKAILRHVHEHNAVDPFLEQVRSSMMFQLAETTAPAPEPPAIEPEQHQQDPTPIRSSAPTSTPAPAQAADVIPIAA